MTWGRLGRSERGASEVFGFVLTFSLIMLSVGVVYVGGTDALGSVREAQRADSAQTAVESLAESVARIERGDPARAGELSLSAGSLGIRNETTVSVTVDLAGGGSESFEFAPGSIAYESGETTIVYESGSVLRLRDDDSIMTREPSIVCGEESAVLSVVSIESLASGGTAGDGSAVVMTRNEGNDLLFPVTNETGATSATAVTVSVDSAAQDGWDRYFESHAGWTDTGSGYECKADAVFVRRTNVSVSIRS